MDQQVTTEASAELKIGAWLLFSHLFPCLFTFETAWPISETTHLASYSTTKI